MKKRFVLTGMTLCFLTVLFTACDLFPPEADDAPAPAPEMNLTTLAGMVYVWEGWGSVIRIEFLSDTDARCTNDGEVSEHRYTYDSAARKGAITGLNSNRRFSISPDGKVLKYPTWGSWGHGFDFYKRG